MTETPAAPIHFHLDEKKVNALTWEEYEALERAQDGDVKLYQLRPLLARFMADENLIPIPHDIAMRTIAKLEVIQVKDVVQSFVEAMKNSAVPKVNGDKLPQPSEPSMAASVSPDGSAP